MHSQPDIHTYTHTHTYLVRILFSQKHALSAWHSYATAGKWWLFSHSFFKSQPVLNECIKMCECVYTHSCIYVIILSELLQQSVLDDCIYVCVYMCAYTHIYTHTQHSYATAGKWWLFSHSFFKSQPVLNECIKMCECVYTHSCIYVIILLELLQQSVLDDCIYVCVHMCAYTHTYTHTQHSYATAGKWWLFSQSFFNSQLVLHDYIYVCVCALYIYTYTHTQ
jgi:hypothetical protein